MKKKAKQKTLWFVSLPEDKAWQASVIPALTRKVLRDRPRMLRENGQSFCAHVFERLMGFLPKVPTKITLTWEE